MKRLFIIAFLLVGAMSVNAQIDLSNILGKVADAVTGKKELTAESIVGTWTYKKPALILESDNALKKLGGTVASGTIENKLATYYKKIGITEGSLLSRQPRCDNRCNRKTCCLEVRGAPV